MVDSHATLKQYHAEGVTVPSWRCATKQQVDTAVHVKHIYVMLVAESSHTHMRCNNMFRPVCAHQSLFGAKCIINEKLVVFK